jgi:hypothetical protein
MREGGAIVGGGIGLDGLTVGEALGESVDGVRRWGLEALLGTQEC